MGNGIFLSGDRVLGDSSRLILLLCLSLAGKPSQYFISSSYTSLKILVKSTLKMIISVDYL